MPVDEVVQRFERTRKLDGATEEGFLLFVFLDTIVDRFFDVSDAVEDRLEAIEDDIFFDPEAAPRCLSGRRRTGRSPSGSNASATTSSATGGW